MARGDFKLVTHPDHQPAVDFLTRSGEGPFVDTGLDVQIRTRPGMPIVVERVYLSTATIAQLARMVGVTRDAAEQQLHDQKLIAQGKLEAIKEGFSGHIADLARDLSFVVDASGVRGDAVAELPSR